MSASQTTAAIVQAVLDLAPQKGRRLIAIAGPPASGKSTVAEEVRSGIIRAGHPCGLLPMDGFHLNNDVLTDRGLLSRKGAPETFDLDGFTACLTALRDGGDVPIPLFDRAQDATLPDAATIRASETTVVVEGNYLLLDTPGWKELSALWSVPVFISAPRDVLLNRLIARWQSYGLTPDAARTRAESNDMRNVDLILAHVVSTPGLLTLQNT